MVTAIATAFVTAIAQAVVNGTWTVFRPRAARVLSQGDGDAETAELERLDRTADELTTATDDDVRATARQEGVWQERLESLMAPLDDQQREQFLAEVRALLGDEDDRSAADDSLSRDTFHGPAAVQNGDQNKQFINNFGSGR